MFENPGKKIKSISVITFWVVVATSIILAFVFGFEKEYHSYYYSYGGYYTTVFNAGAFFSLLIGVPVSAYITTLFLVGFGELVENSSKTESKKEADFIAKQEEIQAEQEQERVVAENIASGREADADPNLSNEEIEAELEESIS